VSTATWDAKKSYAELSRLARKEIAKGNNINFVTFKKGSVLPAGVKDNNEHMYSFDHAYQIEAVREWLFEQYKK
jgi:predicted peptidase